jgi:peptidoglycan/xylan/chitin deacetylase (PgdA/CDA1 family)
VLTGADGHRLPEKITPPVAATVGTGPFGSLRATGSTNVALTFDDGPNPTYTPQILALLKENGIKATFCLVGTAAQAYPKLVQAIVNDGHTLCNHSWQHDLTLGSQSDQAIKANLTRTNDAIHKAVPGVPIKYYRQPGGIWTSRVVAAAASFGMRSLHWAVDPQDWRQPGADAIYNVVSRQTQPGVIVLMHDAGGNRSGTIAACRRLFPQLKARFTLSSMP